MGSLKRPIGDIDYVWTIPTIRRRGIWCITSIGESLVYRLDPIYPVKGYGRTTWGFKMQKYDQVFKNII